MWGELASHKRLFNPPPQFSRLGIQCPALLFFVCVSCQCGGEGENFLLISFIAGMLCKMISCTYLHEIR